MQRTDDLTVWTHPLTLNAIKIFFRDYSFGNIHFLVVKKENNPVGKQKLCLLKKHRKNFSCYAVLAYSFLEKNFDKYISRNNFTKLFAKTLKVANRTLNCLS